MANIQSYKDLKAWQRAMALAEETFLATRSFPKEELYGLTRQARRAAVSVPANIAEGWGRGSLGDYVRFLCTSRASLCELETLFVLANNLGYLRHPEGNNLFESFSECFRILQGLISSLERKQR